MKLYYTITVPTTGSVTLQIPYGISSCKMRMGTNGMVENVGFVSSAGVNQTTDIKFPIINGKSPNTFKISQTGTPEAVTTFYLLITELGGIPDPNYFAGGATNE